MIYDLISLPGAIWRSRYGKALAILAAAMGCLWTGHIFVFELLLVAALNVFALYD
ncbi:hypothetical protein V5738_10795 [Salinisphaera sp. SPP-AMP-43]|uniref:hypothetical protein n=1 Tax=Salinisphaera sp. SPP-AMP-43 TaxID=3121288 RepID=UPI003C6DBB01